MAQTRISITSNPVSQLLSRCQRTNIPVPMLPALCLTPPSPTTALSPGFGVKSHRAILCSQCKGSGVNSVDFFNGKFQVGDSCWLCGGRKEMLCGNCNGAGFVGGFLSTYDQ